MNGAGLRARWISVVFSLSMFLVSSAQAQSPSDGHVEGTAYINEFFNLSYTWPETLSPVDRATLNLRPPAPNGNEFLLFAAKMGKGGSGVIILAERPNLNFQPPNGESLGQSFLDQVKKWLDPAGTPKILAQKHLTNSYGLVFYELDYKHFGEYMSAIVTQVGNYEIVFRCNADSATDLSTMITSVLSTHHFK